MKFNVIDEGRSNMKKLYFMTMITAVVLMFSSLTFGATKDSTNVTGVDTITTTPSYASSGVYGLCLRADAEGMMASPCNAKYPAICNSGFCSCPAGFTAIGTGNGYYRITVTPPYYSLMQRADGSWITTSSTVIPIALSFSRTVCYKE